MTYSVPQVPGEAEPERVDITGERDTWPMWEVFVRQRRGMSHVHAGSLHAPDSETALQNARDVYTRRAEGVSVWVIESSRIHASDPGDEMFDTTDKEYRYAIHYEIPDEVGHM